MSVFEFLVCFSFIISYLFVTGHNNYLTVPEFKLQYIAASLNDTKKM